MFKLINCKIAVIKLMVMMIAIPVTVQASENLEFANVWLGGMHLISFLCEKKADCEIKANAKINQLVNEYNLGGVKYQYCQIKSYKETNSYVLRPDPFDDYKEISKILGPKESTLGLDIYIVCFQ